MDPHARPTAGPTRPGRSRAELVTEVATRLGSVPRGRVVVLACSGGPDSTAMAYLATEARPDLHAVLVHVDHGLRDDDARARDRDVVATHAAWLGVDLVVRDVEVVRAGRGTEAAARDARYAALRAVAAERRAHAILVGHSADDQAETVALRLARGAGLDGVAAMASERGDLLRPLLRLRRADLHRFVELEGLPTSDDATNRDEAVRRVRVRDEVMPALARVGPDPVGALGRLAELVRDDAAALDAAADRLEGAARWVGPVAVLDAHVLGCAPVAIARRVVRSALVALLGEAPSMRTVERVLTTPAGSGATLPGEVELTVEARWRTLRVADAPDPPGAVGLAVPGRTDWPAAGLAIRALTPQVQEPTAGEQIAFALPGVWTPPPVRVDPGVVPPGGLAARAQVVLPARTGSWRVRPPVPGDRLTTGGGTRRVAAILRDAGVPRAVRERWPVVVVDDQPVWLPGVEVDASLRAAGRTDPGVALHLDRSGPRPGPDRQVGPSR